MRDCDDDYDPAASPVPAVLYVRLRDESLTHRAPVTILILRRPYSPGPVPPASVTHIICTYAHGLLQNDTQYNTTCTVVLRESLELLLMENFRHRSAYYMCTYRRHTYTKIRYSITNKKKKKRKRTRWKRIEENHIKNVPIRFFQLV